MAKKSRKNGWDIRERTDPATGQVRPQLIHFVNGEEVEHHWMDINSSGQTEWGAIIDANTQNKIVLRKDELNKKYWKRYASQVDYPGEDTKLEKSSHPYMEKLEEYRNSDAYKKRYATPKIQPVQCKSVTLDGIRCQNMTSDPSGLCHVHVDQKVEFSARCQGKNRDGSRCLNVTNDPNGFCSLHQQQNIQMTEDEQVVTLLDGYAKNIKTIEYLQSEQLNNYLTDDEKFELDERRSVAEKQRKLLKKSISKEKYDEIMQISNYEIDKFPDFISKNYPNVNPPHKTQKLIKDRISSKTLKEGDFITDESHSTVFIVEAKSPMGTTVHARQIFSLNNDNTKEHVTFKNKEQYEIVNTQIIEPISLASKGEYLDQKTRELLAVKGE